MLRKIGNTVKPSQEIKNEGDKWEINTFSTFKNTHIEFQTGVEFEETTADGRTVKVKTSKQVSVWFDFLSTDLLYCEFRSSPVNICTKCRAK